MGEYLTQVTSNMFSPKLVLCVCVLFFIGMEAAPKPKPNPKPEPKPKPQGFFGGGYPPYYPPNYDYGGGNRLRRWPKGFAPPTKFGGKYGNPGKDFFQVLGRSMGKIWLMEKLADGTMQGKDLVMAYSTRYFFAMIIYEYLLVIGI